MQPMNPTIVMAAGKGSRMQADAAVDPETLTEARSVSKGRVALTRSATTLGTTRSRVAAQLPL